MRKGRYVAAINLAERRAIMSDGAEVPITHLVDGDDEDAEPEDAIAFVCGAGDAWFCCRLDEFDHSGRRH